MTGFEKNQKKIERELEEERAEIFALPSNHCLHITGLGRERRFAMREPYFSILNTLEGLERHPVMPEDLVDACKVPFMKRAQVLDSIKHLIRAGYVRAEEF